MFVRMTAAELKEAHARNQARGRPRARPGSHQKYGNQRVTDAEGMKFDSKAEHRHWLHLSMLARAGKIVNLRRQVTFELAPAQTFQRRDDLGMFLPGQVVKTRPLRYVADFTYTVADTGEEVVADVKGAQTDVWRIKRVLMKHVHGIDVMEVRA